MTKVNLSTLKLYKLFKSKCFFFKNYIWFYIVCTLLQLFIITVYFITVVYVLLKVKKDKLKG